MTLSEAQIERYSRQIILPEVGARGQERLLAARIALAGSGPAATTAATLLGRAGIGTLDLAEGAPALAELSPDCRTIRHADPLPVAAADVAVGLEGDRATTEALGRAAAAAGRPLVLGGVSRGEARVLTLVGRPCLACVGDPPSDGADGAEGDEDAAGPFAAAAALTLGALAAVEALRVLVLGPGRGRLTRVGLAGGAFSAADLAPAGPCELCGGSA